jgi:hypothetical protein
VAGQTPYLGAGYDDAWILKLDSNGEIPNCNITNTSNVFVTNTSISGQDTSANVETASAMINDTSMIPQDTSALISVICCYDTDDSDGDGTGDTCDNCPDVDNEDQANLDGDDLGDACDVCPNDPANDIDGDGICGDDDNCPTVANPDQTDYDSDGRGDLCDVSPYFPDLLPAADGHSYHAYSCELFDVIICWDTASYVDNEIIVSDEIGPPPVWPLAYSQYIEVGIMEFDISSIDGLFTSGQIEVYLTLTVKEGDVPDDRCLSLYNLLDVNENGVIEENDIDTEDYIDEVCADLQPGDSITFDVTSAVEHDLFDPDQTDFSSFILRGSDWEEWGGREDWIEFYDHTDLVNGSRLSILAIDSDGDGIFNDEDNCDEIPNGPDLGTCYSWSGMASGTTCLSDADCGGLAGSCSKNQEDLDGDCIGDVCDDFPEIYDPTQPDSDSDGLGDVCDTDDDNDSVLDVNDNCTLVANTGQEDGDTDSIGDVCDNCPTTPNPLQEDTYPPQGNGIGDACDCESDFDCSGAVDANDVTNFLADFGRSEFNNPCIQTHQCYGDTDCNGAVDADDVTMFLQDFGRSQYNNPCPTCVAGPWCVYP